MRILLISSRFHPFTGGVEKVVMNLSREFSREHKVLVIASKMGAAKKASETVEGVQVRRVWLNLPRSPLGFLAFPVRFVIGLIGLIGQIEGFRPEVVNYHFPDDSSVYVYLTKKLLKFPLVTNIHGNDLQIFGKNPWYRFFLKKIVVGSKAIIIHSSYIRDELLKAFPKVEAKVQTVPNGIDEEFFSNVSPSETKDILFYGRLVPKKGVDVLLKAFASVKEELESDLVIVGDGEERKNLEELSEKLGIGGRVRFTGTKTGEPLFAEIRRAKFAVMPSRREPFGIVALELAASGKAIIASRTGGLKEILRDEGTALLFENDDAEELAEKIVRMENDPELRKKLADAAQRDAQNYRWEQIGKRYLDIYKNS